MAIDKTKIIENYIAESLKKGRFLSAAEIDENENIDCSYHTIKNNFEGVNKFRFQCMCEMAVWSKEDLKEFMEQYDLQDKFRRNHPREYRP